MSRSQSSIDKHPLRVLEFAPRDLPACLAIFDSNVPEFFVPTERDQFASFLVNLPGPYLVLEDMDGTVAACGGYAVAPGTTTADLCWGMVLRARQRAGLGRRLLFARLELIRADATVRDVALNTSQHTRGFFERLGFVVERVQPNGYAPGLDRCNMRLHLSPMTVSKPPANHQALILDQFTRGADAFAAAPQISQPEALDLLVSFSGAGSEDTVLDVACGPGLVACAFAPVVRQTTGIDLTPAMIDRARALQEQKGLTNTSWRVGDVLPLPFADASFSIVTCRYAFHHFQQPSTVLAEMKRVCRPGGRIVLADVQAASDAGQAAAFNRMEQLRDPSHVRALPLAELESLLRQTGLEPVRRAFYALEFEVEQLLQNSLPNPRDEEKVRQILAEELTEQRMGVGVRLKGDAIRIAYPIVVFVAELPPTLDFNHQTAII